MVINQSACENKNHNIKTASGSIQVNHTLADSARIQVGWSVGAGGYTLRTEFFCLRSERLDLRMASMTAYQWRSSLH